MKPKSTPTVRLLTGLFLLVIVTFLAYQRSHKPRIFILHSYNQNLPWVTSLNKGVSQIFHNKAYINLRYFYMDTKHLHSNHHIEQVNKRVTKAINRWKPDIIIAFDYEAQNLIREKFANTPKIKVVMAGVTESTHWVEYEHSPNITGITEQIPIKAIREILSLIFHHQKRIFYISDDSRSAKTFDKEISSEDWDTFKLVAHRRVKTFSEWKKAILDAQQSADIILVSTFYTITDGPHQMKPAQLISWLNKHSSIPAVGMFKSFMLNGGMIAIAISGKEQGYRASWLALKIIEKKLTIQDVPLLHGKKFLFFFDKEKLRDHFPKIHIPEILDAFSRSQKMGD